MRQVHFYYYETLRDNFVFAVRTKLAMLLRSPYFLVPLSRLCLCYCVFFPTGGAFPGPVGVGVELRGVCARVHGVWRRYGGASETDGGEESRPSRREEKSTSSSSKKRFRTVHAHAAYLLQGIIHLFIFLLL